MNNCKNCNDKNVIPYAVFELHSAAQERTIKRLWIALLVVIGLLAASNLAWIIYESQWEDVTTTEIEAEQQTDGGGNNYVVGGDFDYGEADGTSETDYNSAA